MKKWILFSAAALLAYWIIIQLITNGGDTFPGMTPEIEREFRQEINLTKKGKGLEVTLKEVLVDLNNVYLKGSVKGREKIVGIEIKDWVPVNALDDSDRLTGTKFKWGIRGLWLGGSWWRPFRESFSLQFPHEIKLEQSQFNFIFYTSLGEKVVFNIPINPELKNKVRSVIVNQEIDLEGHQITIEKIDFGLTQTVLKYNTRSNYKWSELKFSLTDLTTGKDYKSRGSSLAGGGKEFKGNTAFNGFVPVPKGKVKLTVFKTGTGESKYIDIKI